MKSVHVFVSLCSLGLSTGCAPMVIGATDAAASDTAGDGFDADTPPSDAGPNGTDAAMGFDATLGSDSSAPPAFSYPENKVGIGLVSPGNPGQWDLASTLAGPGGHVKLIFPGVELSLGATPQEWIDAVTGSYARDLVPVIRIGPPWGDRNVRSESDDAGHTSFTALAAVYASVVADLPLRTGWPLVIEVHNEANLCYEWECDPADAPSNPNVAPGWIHYTDTAAEYAAFLRDVTIAIHALGDPRILVINGGLAPGGTIGCECGGAGFTPGITSREFLMAMETAVPGVHAALDAFASHSYPASGEGWGFFETYAASGPGLHYFETELATLGLALPVYMTETGWTVGAGAMGSRTDIASWTVSTWTNDWLPHPDIRAVMPFILQDGAWDDFAWVDPGGTPYPVYDAVVGWRCGLAYPEPC